MTHEASQIGAMDRLARLRRASWVQAAGSILLVLLAPVLVLATWLVLGPFATAGDSPALKFVILADLVYVILVVAVVAARLARMVIARRQKSAGSRLHMRLTATFALVALVPTVLVAIFAFLSINMGLEGWFSERVRSVVGSSLAAAQAYEAETRMALTEDADALARYLDAEKRRRRIVPDSQLRQLLAQGQAQIQRGLREAYIIDRQGNIRVRGERSYLFDYERPSPEEIARALAGETVIIDDWPNNEMRALVALKAFPDHLLYVSRQVDGRLLSLLDDTQQTVRFYNQLEAERGKRLFQFGLIYLGFAVILILGAVLVGMWFAERLSEPIGRLAQAAERVGEGDLDVRVPEEDSDDEIATMAHVFNRMTAQLKAQRDRLVEAAAQTERRRRLFDSVLSSITAGVIGLDEAGEVAFLNRAAERLLGLEPGQAEQANLALLVPEFGPLLERLRREGKGQVQDEVRLARGDRQEVLLVRMAERRAEDGTLEGYVVAFDDVSDLVAAQRAAAWGDVARRIAHEIKNPLTPIQLSAERIRRKFARMADEEAEAQVTQLTEVIIRQTNDLRRIVDEFSRFARMPEPERKPSDLAALVRDAVTLQKAGQAGVTISAELPEGPVAAHVDPTMIGQALTNLIKNAGEATESLIAQGAPEGYRPEIRVSLSVVDGQARIEIADNGIGLPTDRSRLFEPYVTTREKGTGLGLAIVKKIIEEHGGTLSLVDAEPFSPGARAGAMAVVVLPLDIET